jgi:hypothetical protein
MWSVQSFASEMVAMSSFCIEGGALISHSDSWVVFYLLTPLSDWPIIMIDPGGFLLLVPYVFRDPISFLWEGLQKL